jgi:hypothetical protein
MTRTVTAVFCALVALAGAALGDASQGKELDLTHRYVFIRRNFTDDRHVNEVKRIVQRASIIGYNGIVVSGSFGRIALREDAYIDRLKQVKAICDKYGMELVPLVCSAGYGHSVLAHNKNLAAAVPVRDVPYVVKGGTGFLVKNTGIGIRNGSFEKAEGDRAANFDLQDMPGKLSFVDASVFKKGRSSLRIENVKKRNDGKGRVMQRVAVLPFRCYEVSMWIKTDGLEPASRFQVAVMTEEGRVLMNSYPSPKSTEDWKKVTLGFNSLDYEQVNIFVGVWNGPRGTLWIDDLRIDEVGILNVLHRPGTPVVVRNRATGAVYAEGKDYAPIAGEKLTYKFDHDEPMLKILPGGAIKNGDPIAVDYYQGLALKQGGGQMGVCMSEPEVYEIWEDALRRLAEAISPKRYLLSMDEIRQGGWCESCTSRGMSAAEILGDCITRQTELIREVSPGAEVMVWSDMLDPHHNAVNNYYLFNGDFTGSWEFIPKDLIIAVWKYGIRDKSLAHFDRLGFRTIGCGYYDVDSEAKAKDWIKSLEKTEHACGIMYTTWNDDFDFLEDFARVTIDRYKK